MPTLTLILKGKKINSYSLKPGHTCSIGRHASNDIVIDQPAVSSFHAKIESIARTFVLRDLDSTNGTFINRKRASQQHLEHKDIILIGNHELSFDKTGVQTETTPEPEINLDDKTRILDTRAYDTYRKVLQENTLQSEKPSLWTRVCRFLKG